MSRPVPEAAADDPDDASGPDDGSDKVRRLRRPTATSAFGVSRRESHDASGFYDRFTPPVVSDDDEVRRLDQTVVDHVWTGDARELIDRHVVPGSVALMVTSPPYFAGKAYEEELGKGHIPVDYLDYLGMLRDVIAASVRALEPGGRLAVNVANLGRKPYRSLSADVISLMEEQGLLLRGEVIWRKAVGASGSCAWGTYQSPRNPVLRDTTERVVIASKGRFDRALDQRTRAARGLPHEATVHADAFLENTLDVWDLPPESARRVGHPAPFPVELPQRLIELLTYRGDLVLDPFMGAGSTAVAAVRSGRHFLGTDTDPSYVELTEERVAAARAAATEVDPEGSGAPYSAALAQRRTARDLAQLVIEGAGFVDVRDRVKIRGTGIEVTYTAVAADGTTWRFLVGGGHGTPRPGLRRSELVWRLLGEASTLHFSDPGPLVVLTTDQPPASSALGKALRAATGPDRPIRAVIDLLAGVPEADLAAVVGG